MMTRHELLRDAERALLEAKSYAKCVNVNLDEALNRVYVDAADTWTFIAEVAVRLAAELREEPIPHQLRRSGCCGADLDTTLLCSECHDVVEP